MDTYPQAPGWKADGTSRDSAEIVRPTAVTLRARCVEVLRLASLTADQCAGMLGESILSIRPRLSELHAQGLIRDSGRRRPNSSGHSAIVWELAQAQPLLPLETLP